ncbi:hypothetical protein QBC43DRAFT_357268 [Cladorrhinum sp. PSN259]|nr:hypothetical protein QBC43DRAFT_357268 [Cladorrhinum sp. PSN259]
MTDPAEISARWRDFEHQHRPLNGARSPKHGRAYDDLDIDELPKDCVLISVHKKLLNEREKECDELYERKEWYKKLFLEMQQERDQVQVHLEEALKLAEEISGNNHNNNRTSSSELTKLRRDNEFLHQKYTIATTFLSNFGAQDFNKVAEQWNQMSQRLERAEGQLTRLQTEVLSSVDRFDPNYDAHLINKFCALNKSIGLLTKSKDLRGLELLADPLGTWDHSVFWPESINPALKGDSDHKLTDGEKRLLFRHAIWKFLTDHLFCRSRPFASYGGGEVGELASNLPFEQLYPDHLTSEPAAKWRSLTTRALLSHPLSPESKTRLISTLSNSFSEFLSTFFLSKSTATEPSSVKSVISSGKDAPKRLTATLSEAIDFSRLLFGERAGFEILSPLPGRLFKKEESDAAADDAEMTVLGANVGVVDGPDVENEVDGQVKLLGSPMLVKWGNGGGRDLGERGVLVRGFVVLF